MSEQHSHQTTPFVEVTKDIIIICDGLQSPANIGALFRLGDAFGIKEIVFCNASIDFDSNRLKRTARNTVARVSHRVSEDIMLEINQLLKHGYQPVALEITDTSMPLQAFTAETAKGLFLVIGNEKHGISAEILELIPAVHIEMFGRNSSMNVIQATAIALYALTR